MIAGDADLSLVFSVTVSDGTQSSASSVTVTITAPANLATPVASAGAAQSVSASASVTLDASASSDADGQTLTYAWTQTSGTTVALSDTSAASPTFTAPAMAIGDADLSLVFSVTVKRWQPTPTTAPSTVTVHCAQLPTTNAPVCLGRGLRSLWALAQASTLDALPASIGTPMAQNTDLRLGLRTSGNYCGPLSDASAASPNIHRPQLWRLVMQTSALVFSVHRKAMGNPIPVASSVHRPQSTAPNCQQ